MKKILNFAVGALLLLVFSVAARAQSYEAYLTGAQEVPSVATTATGKARVVVNPAGTSITWDVTYTGLTSAQILAHIHEPAAVGSNAGVQITFANPGGTSGTISGSGAITPTQLAQLRAGLAYVNIHSTNNSGGEIRGQLNLNRPVDYDGDGKMDLSVLQFPSTGSPQAITYWNLRSTDGVIAQNFGDAARDFPVPGDYDGDGKGDLALYRNGATPLADSFFLIFRSSTSTFLGVQFGFAGDQAVCRDYDGDGITDMAVYRRGALGDPAYWFIRQSGAGFVQRSVQWGLTGDTAGGTSGDFAVPGDYDGDGKFDIAVYRFNLDPAPAPNSNNNFIILRSSDSTAQFVRFGDFNSDYILPGDYDGDGKCDFMAARTGAAAATVMNWALLRSSDGAITNRLFGRSDDLPTQGDYDGDGRADISVYRRGATTPAASTFFWIASLTNTVTGLNFGARPDFPVATFDAR